MANLRSTRLVSVGLLVAVDFVRCDAPVRWQHQAEPRAMGCNQRLQTDISIRTNRTLAAIDIFKENFSWHKFHMGWDNASVIMDASRDNDFLLLCDESDECSRVLPVVPLSPYSVPTNESHARQLMAEILEYSQQYAIGLETLFLDQSLHADSFLPHVNEIHGELELLVSGIIWGLKLCRVPVRETTLRDLMEKSYEGASRTLRDERAFRTVRQCQLGLHYIRHFFSLNEAHPLLR
ncbi:uncharacterized protein LOC135208971 isoform X1 [Macrobrachium nipponense]|uniref:uncharacterized protein LOC135208971 isoform X1 n=1 Tax=Macrobrachium nipponense TaxID=159736 RepID=UPI0030C7B38B